MDKVETILDTLVNSTEAELRETVFALDGDRPAPQRLYPHQSEGLRRMEMAAQKAPPVSGILHYPTGAGKTRVALEFAARLIRANPDQRIVWATARKVLIQQTMIKLAELSRLFPDNTTFAWSQNADNVEKLDNAVHILFMTRSNLTQVLERAGDGRVKRHPWRRHLENGLPMTLIYDECHQLGAAKLQEVWERFHEQVVRPSKKTQRSWMTVGLSATPVPTAEHARRLVGEVIFPVRQDGPITGHGSLYHVFHRVQNQTLIDSGVLCPVSTELDGSGYYDIPAELLRRVTGATHVEPPGADAERGQIQEYSAQFNQRVMTDPEVLTFLAERVGGRLSTLGKTIVFVPTIEAANRLVQLFYDRVPATRGAVAVVHHKLKDARLPEQRKLSVHEVLERFRKRGDEPSILVNVDMLTEGFDDPKIKTVVLARLTLSTNRFWQMIGRGTRGPTSEGTLECHVIDPVKLVRLYDYFAGYQPNIHGGRPVELELEDEKDPAGDGGVTPEVPVTRCPPNPMSCTYTVSPEAKRINSIVRVALDHFLKGEPLSEKDLIEASRTLHVDLSEGMPVLRPSTGGHESVTATVLLAREIGRLEAAYGKDLRWFQRRLSTQLDATLTSEAIRELRAIESMSLWTEASYANARMTQGFLAYLEKEALGQDARAASPRALYSFSAGEAATLAAAFGLLSVEGAGEALAYEERFILVNTFRELFGTRPSAELESALVNAPIPTSGGMSLDNLRPLLNQEQRQRFLRLMAELATAKDSISPARHRTLVDFARQLEIPVHITSAILDFQDPNLSPISGVSCRHCSFDLPSGASFCPGCGESVRVA